MPPTRLARGLTGLYTAWVMDGYETLHTGLAVLDRSTRNLLALRGPDRFRFLHGMVSHDVLSLTADGVRYAAVLTAKGAMVGDVRILQRPDELWLDCEPGLGPKLLAHLGRFLISEDAELSDISADFACLTILGPKARQVLGPVAVPEEGHWAAANWGTPPLPVLFTPAISTGVWGLDIFVRRDAWASAWEEALKRGATPLRPEVVETTRVEAGIPRYGIDMGDDTLPLEANLGHALSNTKGCYVGQETIARVTHRGQLQWRLGGILAGAQPLTTPLTLFHKGRKQGLVTSCVHSPRLGQYIALAFVHRDSQAAGTRLHVGDSERVVEVTPLPFLPKA